MSKKVIIKVGNYSTINTEISEKYDTEIVYHMHNDMVFECYDNNVKTTITKMNSGVVNICSTDLKNDTSISVMVPMYKLDEVLGSGPNGNKTIELERTGQDVFNSKVSCKLFTYNLASNIDTSIINKFYYESIRSQINNRTDMRINKNAVVTFGEKNEITLTYDINNGRIIYSDFNAKINFNVFSFFSVFGKNISSGLNLE